MKYQIIILKKANCKKLSLFVIIASLYGNFKATISLIFFHCLDKHQKLV
jgi:hypothetical protein